MSARSLGTLDPESRDGHSGATDPSAPSGGDRRRESMVRRLIRRPVGVVAGVWLLLVIVGAVFAPLLAPYDPENQDLSVVLSGPTGTHLLGTDPLGRDVLSQLLYGARPTLLGVLCALVTWLILGTTLGLIGGYMGGIADSAIGRIVDLLLSLPPLVILLVVFAVFPGSLYVPMALLGVIASAGLVRVVRSVTLTVREELYIRAARVAGLSHLRIIVRHVFPRISSTLIVQASLFAGVALVIESGLAFLGFGVVLPNPSWGGVIQEASQVLPRSAWLLVPSGGAVGLTVVAFVLLGNAVRDVSTADWAPSQLSRRTRRSAGPAIPSEGSSDTPPRMPSPDAVLSVEELSVETIGPNSVQVVTDVSFTVNRGETVAVLGESGCGKTVTTLAVLGLLPSGMRRSAGRVMLGETDLTAGPSALESVRGRRVGYVAQEPMLSLDPTYTVGSQIAEAVRRHHGLSRRDARLRAVELLAAVNIREPETTARRYTHQLSGGMLQRCVIALALSGDPELLIADEPTTALDVTVQAEILGLLRRIQKERGMAMILVTHDWGVVASVADRAVVMYAGEIVEEAPVSALVSDPRHPYARALIASHPALASRGERLPAIGGSVPPAGLWTRTACRFAPRCIEASEECRRGPVPLTMVDAERLARCVHASPSPVEMPQ